MDRITANKIKDELEEIMKKYPEWGFVLFAERENSNEFMSVGNLCIPCLLKEVLILMMTGRIQHLDNHEPNDDFQFMNMGPESDKKH